jgi:hypothetical protein
VRVGEIETTAIDRTGVGEFETTAVFALTATTPR